MKNINFASATSRTRGCRHFITEQGVGRRVNNVRKIPDDGEAGTDAVATEGGGEVEQCDVYGVGDDCGALEACAALVGVHLEEAGKGGRGGISFLCPYDLWIVRELHALSSNLVQRFREICVERMRKYCGAVWGGLWGGVEECVLVVSQY